MISAPLFLYPTMLCAVFSINKITPKTNILTKLVNNNKRKVSQSLSVVQKVNSHVCRQYNFCAYL